MEITNPTSTDLRTQSLKEFASANNIASVSNVVRENTNGYPFITFIDKDNQAENIYFSKKASEELTAGQPVTKELLKDFFIIETENAQGETRLKLSKGASTRVNIEDLF